MGKLGSLQFLRILAAVALLVSSGLVIIFSDSVNDAVTSTVRDTQENIDYDMVGLSDEERWPVLRVSFPGKAFPNSLLGGIFDGDLSAQQYISEISGGNSQLIPTIIDGVWESPYDDSHWGTDSEFERDSGDGSGGAREMATQAIVSLLQEQDLSTWDLNGDFVIDRLLILHSGNPQEEGGPSSTIWSHFSPFQDPIEIGDYRFEHYTMASVHGGLGVTVHEMLHQMGAVDLYDVHSDSPTKSWYGLGDWDIMASGNWLGDGDMPSLPSSTTLELIGATNPIIPDVHLDGNFTLRPISQGGSPLKIEISQGEFIWLTLRSDIGFDRGLPGHGILVEQQDISFGDIGSNLVNTDPTKPWVKIVEADGNDALLRARDYGSSGDTFSTGDRFGHTGHQIWDNRGRLVPWTITVTSLSVESTTIEYDFVGDPYSTIELPRNPIVLLPNETAQAVLNSDIECDFTTDLSNHPQIITKSDGAYILEILNLSSISSAKGEITGTLGCVDRPMTHISLGWSVVNHRLSAEFMEATIAWDEPSIVEFYPESTGDGPRIYTITVDGPAGRISESVTSGTYFPGDPIVLAIEPDGLLEPRMIARGELVIVDSNNIEQRIPIVLNSQGELPFGPFNWLAIPSNAISTVLVLLAFSVATSSRKLPGDIEKSL
tara:strand:- start:19975 stop:21951 length:1977 start_codon:yes stop_codon:yes gene_type:complete